MQAVQKKLRVSAILLGIIGGIVGLASGLFLGSREPTVYL
jgi:hypothetical protein